MHPLWYSTISWLRFTFRTTDDVLRRKSGSPPREPVHSIARDSARWLVERGCLQPPTRHKSYSKQQRRHSELWLDGRLQARCRLQALRRSQTPLSLTAHWQWTALINITYLSGKNTRRRRCHSTLSQVSSYMLYNRFISFCLCYWIGSLFYF